MGKRSTTITGKHPILGTLFATIDPTVQFTEPKVTDMQFSSLLAPFKTREAAEAALVKLGAAVNGEASR